MPGQEVKPILPFNPAMLTGSILKGCDSLVIVTMLDLPSDR
jgi:hypothetical protein